MNATELIQQYQSGAITARELVEGLWDAATFHEGVCESAVYIGPFVRKWNAKFVGGVDSAWTAAAVFTATRIEEIWQVKEEIEWVQDCIDMSGITEPEKGIPEQRRILAREQSALAELSRGLKKEVLA
jgi:hypothetical protein